MQRRHRLFLQMQEMSSGTFLRGDNDMRFSHKYGSVCVNGGGLFVVCVCIYFDCQYLLLLRSTRCRSSEPLRMISNE